MSLLLAFTLTLPCPLPLREDGNTIVPDEVVGWEWRIKEGRERGYTEVYLQTMEFPVDSGVRLCVQCRPVMLDGTQGEFSKKFCAVSQ